MYDDGLREDMIDNALSYAQGFDWDVLTLRFYNQLSRMKGQQKNVTTELSNELR